MSRHISHAWRGSSPPLGTRGAEFSLVSATVVETVDRSRDRQTYVPSKIQEGTAIISAVYRHPLLLFEEEFFRGLLRVPAETVTDNWNHVPLVHTRICTGHTHIFTHAIHVERQQRVTCQIISLSDLTGAPEWRLFEIHIISKSSESVIYTLYYLNGKNY